MSLAFDACSVATNANAKHCVCPILKLPNVISCFSLRKKEKSHAFLLFLLVHRFTLVAHEPLGTSTRSAAFSVAKKMARKSWKQFKGTMRAC